MAEPAPLDNVRVGVVRGGIDGRVIRPAREGDGGENYAEESERESRGAERIYAFAAEQSERDGERGIGRRDRAGDADQADFEGAV